MTPESTKFHAMAERIEHNANAPNTFGGAAVIVPPAGGGNPVEILVLDAHSDPAQFWATLTTRISQILTKIDENRRQVNLR